MSETGGQGRPAKQCTFGKTGIQLLETPLCQYLGSCYCTKVMLSETSCEHCGPSSILRSVAKLRGNMGILIYPKTYSFYLRGTIRSLKLAGICWTNTWTAELIFEPQGCPCIQLSLSPKVLASNIIGLYCKHAQQSSKMARTPP